MRPLLTLAAAFLTASVSQAQDLYDDSVLRTLSLQFQDAQFWQTLKNNYGSGTNILADLTVDNVVYPDVGVRLKGNSSYFFLPPGSKKASFNIEMDHVHVDQRLYGYKTINLNNSIEDPTFCREMTFFNFIRKYTPAGRGNHVVLKCNGNNWGVYVNVQQYNKQLLEEYFVDEDGARFKCPNNPNGPGLEYKGANYALYQNDYELRDDGGDPDPWKLLVDSCDVLTNEPLTSWENIDAQFSVDAALWQVAVENLFMDEDSYISKGADFNVYWDPLNMRMHLHQHDGNESFGVSLFGWPGGTHWELNPLYNKGKANKPVLNRLLAVPELQQRYLAHYRTLLEEFRWDLVGPKLLAYKAMLDAEVAADNKKIYTYQDFLDNFTIGVMIPDGVNGMIYAPGLQEFFENRRAFLLTHPKIDKPAPAFDSVSLFPAAPQPADTVFVTARVQGPVQKVGAVTLYWRAAPGRYFATPMLDDGLSGDGAANDDVWGVELPVTGSAGLEVEYYVGAASNGSGAMTFHPRRTETAPLSFTYGWGDSGLKITEYMYSGIDGELIELTNTSAAPLDVTGWSLDDQSSVPGTFDLSAAGVLAAGESFLVTSADPATFSAAWGIAGPTVLGPNVLAPFGRNDQINVFDAAGDLVERLTYGDEDIPGSPRAKDQSANGCVAALGADAATLWTLSESGDVWGSWTSTGGDVGSPGTFTAVDCPPLGTSYCDSNSNSTGVAAQLAAFGSAAVEDNDVTFQVEELPQAQFGYFLMSDTQGFVPLFGGSQGNLCLGGSIVRFDKLVLNTGATGSVLFQPDLTDLPQGIVFQPGELWSFQMWYRDVNPAATSNTTNGVEIQFE